MGKHRISDNIGERKNKIVHIDQEISWFRVTCKENEMKTQKELFGIVENKPKHEMPLTVKEAFRKSKASHENFADWEIELLYMAQTKNTHKLRVDFVTDDSVRFFTVSGELCQVAKPGVIEKVNRDLDVGDTFGRDE